MSAAEKTKFFNRAAICENRLCVNPNHLEILTRSEHRKQHMREWGWNVSE